jgi:bisphosphoglycerate-dependent phosphoglycerate mutase
MIDNIELIKPLLKFQSNDDFYYVQILQRKKENKLLTSNSRVIKNYYIKSVEHLESVYDEIKTLCNVFNARASIRLNKRSYRKVAFKTMQNLANTMSNKEYSFVSKSYDRACGQSHNDTNKKWILDIDCDDWMSHQTEELLDFLWNLEPVGNKYIAEIPSKSGLHFITSPFNIQTFNQTYVGIDIHKDNPTNLYIPTDIYSEIEPEIPFSIGVNGEYNTVNLI